MIRKIVFEEDEGWCWEIEKPDGYKMWISGELMSMIVNHHEIKEEYKKMEESK